jgi:hypothetical protein
MEETARPLRRDDVCRKPDRKFIIVYPGNDKIGRFSLRQMLP